MSRDFRKSALLAKSAWDQLLQSLSRQDPESQVQRYRDEADKAEAAAKADQQKTTGDLTTHRCLIEYETRIIEYSIELLKSKSPQYFHGDSTSAYIEAYKTGNLVDAVLSDGFYSDQCDEVLPK